MDLLHIAEDQKFIDSAIDQFEKKAPGQNIFLINSPDNPDKLKFIKRKSNVITAPYPSGRYEQVLKDKNFDVYIFHNFIDKYKWELLLKLPAGKTKILMAWGSEIYSMNKLNKNILTRKTAYLVKQYAKKKKPITKIKEKVKTALGINKNDIEHYLKMFDYLSPVIIEDYELVNKYIKLKYIPFSYLNVQEILNDIRFSPNKNGNILIGNSGYPVNNHIDIIHFLKKQDLNGRKIIVPLNYGRPEYIEMIKDIGSKAFGDNFIPILDFLPIEEYNGIINSCGIAFMNSIRQHALGTINLLLLNGVNVVLNSKGIMYRYCERENLFVQKLSSRNLKIENLDEKKQYENYQRMTNIIKQRELYIDQFFDSLRNNLSK